MIKPKLPKHETCSHCGSTGKFEEIQQFIYAPPMTRRKLITRIARCPNCKEMVGTISKHQLSKECDEDV